MPSMPSKGPITLQRNQPQKAASLADLRLRVCNDTSSDSGSSSREILTPVAPVTCMIGRELADPAWQSRTA